MEQQFVRIAKRQDFEGIRFKRFRLLARPMAVFSEPDGSFFALEMSCKHANADLTLGTFNGDCVTCPAHGWRYDIRTGECLNHPSAPLRRYRLRVEGDDIYISLTPIAE